MNTIRVLFIRPPYLLTKANRDFFSIPFPLSLVLLAAMIRKKLDCEIKIIDSLVLGYNKSEEFIIDKVLKVGLSDNELAEKIRIFRPDIIGITNSFTAQVESMFYIAAMSKNIYPTVPIVVGGVHPTLDPISCIKNHNIDFVCQGEGEHFIVELIESLFNKKLPLESVKNLYFKKGDAIVFTGKRNFNDSLDSLPLPAYDLLPINEYAKATISIDSTIRGGNDPLWASIITSRGCPYSCNFCSVQAVEGKKWRFRSPEHVVNEIELLYNKYGIRTFTIEDSNFTLDIERAKKICEYIIKRKLFIKFSLPNGIRADRITKELVKKMKDAGCNHITLAVEHGDQDFLNNVIKKNLDINKVLNIINEIKYENIALSCFFILGIPPENKLTLKKTKNLIIKFAKLGIFPLLNIVMPLPETDLTKNAIKEGFLDRYPTSYDLLFSSNKGVDFKNMEITRDELLKIKRNIYIQAALILLIYHPLRFFRFPFIKNTLKDLTNIRTIKKRFYKLIGLIGTRFNNYEDSTYTV